MDLHPEPADHVGEAAHQLRRVHARRVGVEARTPQAGDVNACPRLLGVEQDTRSDGSMGEQSLVLGGRAGDVQHSRPSLVGGDPLALTGSQHLVDRAADGGRHRCHAGVARAVVGGVARELGRQPAAVATGGAVAGELRLQHADVQPRARRA